jgi:hypothetical protein
MYLLPKETYGIQNLIEDMMYTFQVSPKYIFSFFNPYICHTNIDTVNFILYFVYTFLTPQTEAILNSEHGEYMHFSSTDSYCFQDYQTQLLIQNIRLFTINSNYCIVSKYGLCFTYIGIGVHILEYEVTRVLTFNTVGILKKSYFLIFC